MKKFISPKIFVFTAVLLMVFALASSPVNGQVREPDIRAAANATTPLDKGLDNRIGGSAFINNFGFGISGVYSHAFGPFTEGYFSTGITGIRDVSEQSFTNFFTGQRIIPNKFNRALGFPFMFGIKKRVFPNQIADNFRFFFAAAAGPSLAFVTPYIDDENDNGFRDTVISPNGITRPQEEKNGFFQGWGDGSTEWGAAGEIKVGVDLGSNFKRQSTLEIGFFFYYFDQGLQIMEPNKPAGFQACGPDSRFGCPIERNEDGERVAFFDAQKFFGTPQIKFTFSGWW